MLLTIFFYFEMICYCCLTWYGSGHSLFVVFHPLEVNQQYLSGLGEMYKIIIKWIQAAGVFNPTPDGLF